MKLQIEESITQNSFGKNFSLHTISHEDTVKLLNAGIQCAKDGNRAEARTLLLRVTESDSANESAWLWLASISEYPEELIVFLQKVLDINPQNQQALEWLAGTKSLFCQNLCSARRKCAAGKPAGICAAVF